MKAAKSESDRAEKADNVKVSSLRDLTDSLAVPKPSVEDGTEARFTTLGARLLTPDAAIRGSEWEIWSL